MKPTFSCAIRYRAEAKCVSPLRTGAENDPEKILFRADGTPFLQGTSLAGALRAWHDSDYLFGSQSGEGSLRVSDLLFPLEKNAGRTIKCTRPRLRIDGKTGAAANGAKFDVAALTAGTRGEFTLIWRGEKADCKQAAAEIEAYLAALHSGGIRLGAVKTNGFGQIVLTVWKQEYDLFNERDRQDWLDGTVREHQLILPEAEITDRIQFVLHGSTDAVLIKAPVGRGVGAGSVDSVHLCENGRRILPGSSIKGAVRAHIVRIAPFCGVTAQEVDRIFGRPAEEEDNGIAGKVCFSEAVLEQSKPAPIMHRIRINRLSGGVLNKGLFSQQPENGSFELHISLPAEEKTGAFLLYYALRDLGLGLYSLGSGASVGLGRIAADRVEIRTPEGEAVLSFREGIPELRDKNGIVAVWRSRTGRNAE